MIRNWLHRAGLSMTDDPEVGRLADVVVLLIGGTLSFLVFARIPVHALSPNFVSEFRNHALLLKSLEAEGSTPYSLWYALQESLIRDNRDEVVMLNSGWLLLGGLAVVKGIVLTGSLLAVGWTRTRSLVVALLLGTAVAFPIPFLDRTSKLAGGVTHYLGTLPPNVFMSSTQLLANTTAVVAVLTLTLWYRSQTTVRFISMVLAGAMATLAKPGITPALLATISVLTLMAIWKDRASTRTALTKWAVAVLLLGVPLFIVYRAFMSGQGWLQLHSEIRPLDTWLEFSDQWFVDLLASWAFPLVVLVTVLVARWRGVHIGQDWLAPAWSVALIATSMFVLLSEVDRHGDAFYAGNFAWGAIAANSGLYLLSAIAVYQLPWRWRAASVLVLVAHALGGVLYLREYIASGTFI